MQTTRIRSVTLTMLAAVLLSACGAPASSAGAPAAAVALSTISTVHSTVLTTGARTSTTSKPAIATPMPATVTPAVATTTPEPVAAVATTRLPVASATHEAPAAIQAQIVEPNANNYQSWTYRPDSLTVHVGQAVTWTNVGEAAHTVTADTSAFDSGTLGTHQAWTFVFSKVGAYAYHCTFHPWMKGTVNVLP